MGGVQWYPGAGYDPFLNNAELTIGAVLVSYVTILSAP